ncbi:hypothetical protein BMR99_03490 [Propionibacterium freudenreichii]|uniref:Uncharacterized protein n=1 Tax=Propionibacterium freudenreichii TaxID=1744 RepID=A0A509MHB5_9ACTN|nr:hypothetical protein [Propionibacterium freudenreichii]ARO11710.1 hypothetical protein BMR99_03490 [Propionibacterium freudenreichii]SCQ79581.1 Hypothetical protein PFR_JS23_1428 [Propionibacterium freudenreichii]SCQ83224.1 Hypothetical protein PFR_JS23-PH_36 [Propionibacterium freudenreichii]SUY93594.1 Hypothetical protein PFR_JS23-PH_36 [Propionibacterium freudenreichii]
MTDRDDLNHFHEANDAIQRRAINDLNKFWARLAKSDPKAVRAAMDLFVPQLIASYGELAAEAAARWYEELRPADKKNFQAELADPVSDDIIEADVAEALGASGAWDTEAVQGSLADAIRRQVFYMARATVARNIAHDPKRPRFARVPRGAVTCAFCTMLASRGWVYYTAKTAGITRPWHRKCDCQIVPEWKRGNIHFAGYDPDKMFEQYAESVDAVGSSFDTKAILADMRRRHPEALTDGVVNMTTPSAMSRPPGMATGEP